MKDARTEHLDVTGDVCPMPIMKTKKALESLSDGDILEVTADYPLAKENIIRLANDLKQEVVDVVQEGHLFHVTIRKREG